MKSKYILLLYKQYCDSIGKEYDYLNITKDNNFVIWLYSLLKQTIDYSKYLSYLGVNLFNKTAIELNKGKYDSFGKESIMIVSPFAETLGSQNSEIIVVDNTPLVITEKSIFTPDYDLFLTHNPLNNCNINDLISLHNNGSNICIGVYGTTSDKDRKEKLKMLRNLSLELTNGIQFYYDTDNDNYCGCIKSERKIKEKYLTR